MPAAVLAVVAIVSVDVPELLAIAAGLKAHVAPVGSPVHESVTELLKPNVGATVTVEVAEFPAVTGAGDKAPVETSGSGARVTFWLLIQIVYFWLYRLSCLSMIRSSCRR